jgi:hypothetical protein
MTQHVVPGADREGGAAEQKHLKRFSSKSTLVVSHATIRRTCAIKKCQKHTVKVGLRSRNIQG